MSLVLNGTNQYLKRTVVLSITPMSFACWFKADDVESSYPIMASDDGNDDIHILQAAGNVEGDPVRVGSYDSGWAFADSSAGYSAEQWYHAGAAFADITSRKAYINGASIGENNVSKDPTGELWTWLGSYKNAANVFSGKLAEAAIWSDDLTDDEMLQLARGVRPSAIRPSKLVAYWPLIDDPNDVSGNSKHMTEYNSPSYDTEDHPEMGNTILAVKRHFYDKLLIS